MLVSKKYLFRFFYFLFRASFLNNFNCMDINLLKYFMNFYFTKFVFFSTPSLQLYFFHSSFRKYLDCSEFVTRKTCGAETGLFIRGFLHRMSSSLMQNYCEEYYKGSNHCSNEFSTATRILLSAFLLTFIDVSIFICTIRRIS